MLDQKLLRAQPEKVRHSLNMRGDNPKLVDDFLSLDEKWRTLLQESDRLKGERNTASEAIGRLKKTSQDTQSQQENVRKINERIKALDDKLLEQEQDLKRHLLFFPNLLHATVPPGKGSSENAVIKSVTEGRTGPQSPKPHWEITEQLELIDFTRAAKLSGPMFAVYVGAGAKLLRSLVQFMLDYHIRNHHYLEVYPPFLVKPEILVGTGQFPKFNDGVYQCEIDGLFLIPTAEVPVTNLHRDEILSMDELPKQYVSYTACFRREAGAAGTDTRGLQRLHQFDKVELVKLTTPESSYNEHEKLLNDAEDILKALELPYRVLLLCAGDTGFSAAKCYDLETWCPSQQKWLEVSSCSNFEDFQARRANLRFRRDVKSKPEFLHTLNASGLAIPRIMISILETYQESDGSISIPHVLQPYMDGAKRIGADFSPRLTHKK